MVQNSGRSQGQNTKPNYDRQMSWRMRWFFAVVFGGGFLVSTLTALVGFAWTRDTRFLIFISPTIFTPIVALLIPMDEKRYRLQALTIRAIAASKRRNSGDEQQKK